MTVKTQRWSKKGTAAVLLLGLGTLLAVRVIYVTRLSPTHHGIPEAGLAAQRMSPTYVDFVPPQSYTQSSLMEELRTRLTPEELALIVNPLVSTPEIDRWARQVTAGATNDETRARMLFDLLALRARDEIVGTNVVFAMRTAQEAFAAWNRPTQALTCKDFAFLYVVMARAVGITAYDVEVEEEAEGPQAAHSCAAIILGKRRLLVDPTFNWFGVPHKKFIVLNDLQAAAVYVGQLANPKCPEIARKLAPELPIIQMNYFEHLVNFGRLNEARDVLQNLKRLDIITAGAREYADGNLALGEGRAEYAVGLLLKAVAMNPYDSNWRITLARACVEAGDVTNAVDNFREALHSPIISSDAEFTQFALAHTNELARLGLFSRAGKLLKEGDWTSALKFYDKEIRLWPDDADAYYYRAYARQAKGDTNGASEDYNNAIRLKPELRSSAAARASQ